MDSAIIEKEAMRLSDVDRAILADRLLSSLDVVAKDIAGAWVEESSDRLAAFRSGEIEAVDGPSTMAELRDQFSG